MVTCSCGWEQGLSANKYKRTFGWLKYFKLDHGRQFCEFTEIHCNIHLWKYILWYINCTSVNVSKIKNGSIKSWVSVSCSVVSDFLRPCGLYSPWNSPGQNTGVGSLSFLQGIFPTQGSNPGLPHCRQILYQLSYQGSPY